MVKKVLGIIIGVTVIALVSYFAFIYYVPFSSGIRSGELIKISRKGVAMKTWEGELSQGISGAQIFKFSVLDSEKKVLEDLQNLQGHYVKLNYEERYKTFSWWGDSRYFITGVTEDKSPFK